jgi:hypothetical protein
LTFETNGTTRLTLASTGAATFTGALSGTSATFSAAVNAQLLTIQNGYYLVGRNAANTAFRTLLTFDSSNRIIIGQDSDITAITLGVASEAMRITSGGNVSIGTTNSTARFNIQASSNFENATLGTATGTMGYLSANGLYGMYIGIGNSGNTWLQSQRNDGGTTAYNLLLNPRGGNVGIGTSSPLALLHLETGEPTIRITDSSDGGVMFIGNSGGYSYIRPFSRDFRFLNAAGVSMLTIASNSQATFASSITTPSYVQSGVNIAINSSTATTLALVDCAMLLIRDASNGGSCICFFEIGTISIISQSGATTFTTSAPSANQIQLGVGAGSRSVTALGGSNRNGTQVRIGVFRNDGQ